MAPCQELSNNITAKVVIAGMEVEALIDSGATTSCCGYRWYLKNKTWIGPLQPDLTRVIGVGNIPIEVKGRTDLLPFQWKDAEHRISLLVVPTLEKPEVILGMDIMTQLGVKIDIRSREAAPTRIPNYVRPMETWKIPSKKVCNFLASKSHWK